MAIMLVPEQIPKFWEAIKFAAVKAECVEEGYREKYLNRLLYLLLAGKAQCFVRLSAERKLQMLGLTSIQVDQIRDEKTLFAYSLYSFEKVDKQTWIADLEDLKAWAKTSGCKSITTMTLANNEKAIDLLNAVGWAKRFNHFIIELGGV